MPVRPLALVGLPLVALPLLAAAPSSAEVTELPFGAIALEKELTVPGSPEETYDAMTGDISAWWDHTFSAHPKSITIDARPGGGYFEIFDDSGDGVKHAEVIWAERGKVLKLRGPLGFSGNAVDIVHTFTYTAEGDSTRVRLELKAAGQMEEGWAAAMNAVWDHFLLERFKPWVEAGKPGTFGE